MHFFYCDDSGNTGTNLHDQTQPFHYYFALSVPETTWISVNDEYFRLVTNLLPSLGHTNGLLDDADFELKGAHVWNRKKHFLNLNQNDRIAFYEGCAQIATINNCKLIYGCCNKPELARRYVKPFHPFSMAALLCIERIAQFCNTNNELGVVIADENAETESTFRNIVRNYRRFGPPWGKPINLRNLSDNIHYMSSRDSRHIQICDMLGWLINRNRTKTNGIEPQLQAAYRATHALVIDSGEMPY